MGKNIREIEGIGPSYAEALNNVGIRSTDQLLEAGSSPRGRNELGERSSINTKLILRWVNMSDLFRVSGVAGQYAELLEAAGVDTVKELRNRNAENLAEKMREVNLAKHLVRQVPNAKRVKAWIEDAKKLDPMVQY